MPAFTMFELKIRGLFVLEAMLVEADAWHEVLELNGVRKVAAARRAKEGLALDRNGRRRPHKPRRERRHIGDKVAHGSGHSQHITADPSAK